MRPAHATLALLALVLPVAATAQSAEQDYQAGVAARRSGDFTEALQRLDRALESEPENADIHLQIGLVYLAQGRLDQAQTAFRRTLELAPDYEDARLGLARVALRRGDGAAARAELDRMTRGGPEARDIRRQLLATAWRWRLDMDGSYTQIDRRSDWQSGAINIQHRVSRDTIVALLSEATRRLAQADIYTEMRVDHRFAQGSNVYALIGATPDAHHRPAWQIGGGTSVRAHGGALATALLLDFRQARYRSDDIQAINAGAEQYLGEHIWVTG